MPSIPQQRPPRKPSPPASFNCWHFLDRLIGDRTRYTRLVLLILLLTVTLTRPHTVPELLQFALTSQ